MKTKTVHRKHISEHIIGYNWYNKLVGGLWSGLIDETSFIMVKVFCTVDYVILI